MTQLFLHSPATPQCSACQNAHSILIAARQSSSSFLDIFDQTRAQRKARGMPTDEEQDLLRAMMLFAASGLDSMIKQLIRDALPIVIEKHEGALAQLAVFFARALKRKEPMDIDFIAGTLLHDSPRQRVINELIQDLTSASLQSSEQVLRVAAFFDIPSRTLTENPRQLQDIFGRRNQMAHEMDVDFSQPNRTRRPRAKQAMIDDTNELFRVSAAFLAQVDERTQ
jgi:hypothetical protein